MNTANFEKTKSRFHHLHPLLGVNNRMSSRPISLAVYTMTRAGASKEMLMLLGSLQAPYPFACLQDKYNVDTQAMFTAKEAVGVVAGLWEELEKLRFQDGNDNCPYFSAAHAVVEYGRQLVSVSGRTKFEDIQDGLHFCDKFLQSVEGWRHYNA